MILCTTVQVVAQLPQKLKTKSIHFYIFFVVTIKKPETCLDCTLLRAELDRARLRLSVEWQWRDCKHPEDRCRLNAKLRPLDSCWFFCAFVEEDWFCCCCCWDGVLLLFLTELRLWRDVVVVVAPLLLLLLFLTPLLPLLASAAMLPPEPLLDEIANFDDGGTATLPLLLLL